jgi:fusion and transport protein UGO1
MTRHTSYSGPLNGLSRIIKEEGGISGLYFHPHLLIPTILDRGAAALAVLALPRFLAVTLGPAHIAPDTHPLSWALAELVASCAGLLVTVPLETVRRRLQVQVRGHAEPIRGCVETRPAAYNGVVDALWHITTEERSDLPLKPRQSRTKSSEAQEDPTKVQDVQGSESWRKNTGIGQLYRGLSLRVGASLVVFFVGLLSGGEEPELGWTEL